MSDINHRYDPDKHGPLSDTDFAELWEELGYKGLTPTTFPKVVAEIIARVVAAQKREAKEMWATRQAQWDEQRGDTTWVTAPPGSERGGYVVDVETGTTVLAWDTDAKGRVVTSSARLPIDEEMPF